MKARSQERRNLLKAIAGMPLVPALGDEPPPAGLTFFNAIQMGPHTMLDEGIERCLDLIQETAGINAWSNCQTTFSLSPTF
jgi:hypothetical protein